MQLSSLGSEDALEEEMAAHSSVLAWRIPWTEEPGGLQSMGSQRGSAGPLNAHEFSLGWNGDSSAWPRSVVVRSRCANACEELRAC